MSQEFKRGDVVRHKCLMSEVDFHFPMVVIGVTKEGESVHTKLEQGNVECRYYDHNSHTFKMQWFWGAELVAHA